MKSDALVCISYINWDQDTYNPPFSYFYRPQTLTRSIKGRTIRKVMGGEGNFRAAGIFFRYQILGMNFFQALAWIFLRVNWRARIFFHLIFPCANFFFVLRPPPHKFSNGPSLRVSLRESPDVVMATQTKNHNRHE